MEEVWREIPGYEGLYEVSNYGRIKIVKNGLIMKPTLTNKGYYRIQLTKNGVRKKYFIHKIEMEAFVPNPLNLPQVNHKDENKQNNFIFVNPDGSVDPDKSNLEWCTASYNIKYNNGIQKRMNTRKQHPYETTNGKYNITNVRKVAQIKNGKIINEFPSMQEAERQGIARESSIWKCCNGYQQYAGGFQWKYIN